MFFSTNELFYGLCQCTVQLSGDQYKMEQFDDKSVRSISRLTPHRHWVSVN